jgi:YidC/Oxa1 family membrane protein insertase
MDFRRVLLFFALSLLCIYAYGEVVRRFYSSGARGGAAREMRQPESPPAGGPEASATREDDADRVAPAPPPAAVEGEAVVVDTDLYRAEWTTAGGRLRKFQLKQYRTSISPESPPLEIVHVDQQGPFPAGLEIRPLGFDDERTIYTVDRAALSLSGDDVGDVVFRATGPQGTAIEKQIRATGNAYSIDLTVRLTGLPGGLTTAVIGLTAAAPPAPPSSGWLGGGAQPNVLGIVALDGKRFEQKGFDALDGEGLSFATPHWGGFADRYFVTVGLPKPAEGARVTGRRIAGGSGGIVRIEIPTVGSPAEAHARLYFGPKDLAALDAADENLSRVVDFGIFWFVAVPLHWLLIMLHRVTANYGVDIIVLSSVLKVVFLPLTQKSMESMRAMQKLQPEMTKVRERFKDDSERQQKEMMELYRRHRVNPLSGCLPMLLQIPVFVGLYNTLLNAIELRHAPFMGWIDDLSAPERLHIAGVGVPMLAVAMGASMLVQQWMAPAAGDPAQRRMMMIMPVIFTFMFINFPSGLVLYWLVNNLLTIAQQHFVLKSRTAG